MRPHAVASAAVATATSHRVLQQPSCTGGSTNAIRSRGPSDGRAPPGCPGGGSTSGARRTPTRRWCHAGSSRSRPRHDVPTAASATRRRGRIPSPFARALPPRPRHLRTDTSRRRDRPEPRSSERGSSTPAPGTSRTQSKRHPRARKRASGRWSAPCRRDKHDRYHSLRASRAREPMDAVLRDALVARQRRQIDGSGRTLRPLIDLRLGALRLGRRLPLVHPHVLGRLGRRVGLRRSPSARRTRERHDRERGEASATGRGTHRQYVPRRQLVVGAISRCIVRCGRLT